MEGDHALVFEIACSEEIRLRREQVFRDLEGAGLVVSFVTTPSGLRHAAILSAPQERLELEAEQSGISMRLTNDRFLHANFVRAAKDRYATKGGELFSPMERQRLVVGIAEGAKAQGGAELDLDALVSEDVFLASIALHSKEREKLWPAWFGLVLWPLGWPHGFPYRTSYAKAAGTWPLDDRRAWRRALPDFGLVEQPIHAVKAYFGSKIAFYFAWAETYTCWLLSIFYIAIPLELMRGSINDPRTDATVRLVYCIVLGISATLLNELWAYKQVLLAYYWDVLDLARHEKPRPEYLKAARKGLWRLEEYGGHRWRAMARQKGFFAGSGFFVDDDQADETLVMQRCARYFVYVGALISLAFILAFNIVITLVILTFQMLTQQARQFDNEGFLRKNGNTVCAVLLTLNVILSNYFYKKVALVLTDTENQRTQLDYENSLLLKTTLFQFVNSYFAPFYITLVKSQGFTIFGALGFRNRRGDLYKDYCGAVATNATPFARITDCSGSNCVSRYLFVREDCMEELQTLMVSYLVLKPILENLKTFLIPLFNRLVSRWHRKQRRKKAAVAQGNSPNPQQRSVEEQRSNESALAAKISNEMTLNPANGTFGEFDTKILQFGYVTFFSVAFPLGAAVAAIANVVELRMDAFKHTWASRRPTWQGADGIGNWMKVLRAYSWFALLVNVLLLAYASNEVRDYIIIPFLAKYADSDCPPATSTTLLSDEARALGLNISWETSCPCNFRNCFADIGAVSWLPAEQYLDSTYEVTQSYHLEGLCNQSSTLFDEKHCNLCKERISHVQFSLVVFAVLLEHILFAVKIGIRWLVPDKPHSVYKNEARSAAYNDKLQELAALAT